MKVTELLEGALKRSDPSISGEITFKTAALPVVPRRRSSTTTRLQGIADEAGVPLAQVEELYKRAKDRYDNYAVIFSAIRRALGLS